MSDLIERLKEVRDLWESPNDPPEWDRPIQEAITALSPVLPDDVAETIKHCKSHAQWRAMKMLERLQLRIKQLEERCYPSKVIIIGDTGHYVSEAVAEHIEQLEAALSPALPDEQKRITVNLENAMSNAIDRGAEITAEALQEAIALLERQAREIRKLKRRPSVATFNALQEECDGRMVAIKKSQQRIEELEAKIGRLSARGIEDMQDEIKQLEAALKGIAARRHCFSGINGCGAASTARAALQEN